MAPQKCTRKAAHQNLPRGTSPFAGPCSVSHSFLRFEAVVILRRAVRVARFARGRFCPEGPTQRLLPSLHLGSAFSPPKIYPFEINSNQHAQLSNTYLVLSTIVFLTSSPHPRYPAPQTWTILSILHFKNGSPTCRTQKIQRLSAVLAAI